MRKQFFISTVTLLFISTIANATVRRVGYAGVPKVSGVDYTSFYAAYNASSSTAGDTIYVFPGASLTGPDWPTSNDRVEFRKKVIVISKGYWTDTATNPKGNAGLQASKGTAVFGAPSCCGGSGVSIYFFPGSEGSVLMGFDGQGQYVDVQANNITIKRNFNVIIYFDDLSLSNLTVEGNYRVWFEGNDNQNNIYSNIVIKNNFIYQFLLPLKTYTGTISNNTWISNGIQNTSGNDLTMSYYRPCCDNGSKDESNIDLQYGTWLFQNNLMLFYTSGSAATNENNFAIVHAENSTLSFNLALASYNFTVWPGTASNNVFLNPALVSTVCRGFPTTGAFSADRKYDLADNSPALKANLPPGSPSDAGMYGGTTPYKLGMIPSIPTIYQISSPQGNNPTGNTITINLSTRSNN